MYKNYNNNQTSLAVNLDFTPSENHVVTVLSRFVDSIPLKDVMDATAATGRPAYDPRLMMKILLFAYTRKTFHGREIELMCAENLYMKWLIGDYDLVPSYRTINRFRVSTTMAVFIKQAFIQFRELVRQAGLVNDDALFIDGTKLLADANKYTFVWKKSITKYNKKLAEKTRALYDELIQNEVDLAIDQERDTATNVDQMKIVANQVNDKIAQLDQTIETEKPQPGGSPAKQQRRHLKKFQRQLEKDFIPRKTNYDDALATFGDRNSYSKTDHDATFMRMKEDPMRNGQLKPGYNLQIATQHQFTLYYDLYQRPTDTRTLVPFLKTFDFDATPVKYIVADAGYGSESNYEYITDELDKQYLIPYGMYEKEKKKRYRNDPTKIQNWQYDEKNDVFTDYQGIEFHFKNYSIRHDQYGQERKFKVYEAVDYFEDPVRQALAQTPSGRQRQVSINNNWLHFKNYARVQLQSDEGKKIYGQRKIEVEPVFADVKAHLRFTRFSVRGLDKVNNEVGLVLMAMNMIKWAREKAHINIEIRKNQGNEKIDQRKAKITFLWSIYFELCPKLFFLFNLETKLVHRLIN